MKFCGFNSRIIEPNIFTFCNRRAKFGGTKFAICQKKGTFCFEEKRDIGLALNQNIAGSRFPILCNKEKRK